MSGIFPRTGAMPSVSNDGVDLINTPVACDAAYYNEDCVQRVDPASLNTLISELVSVINACPDSVYDCDRRDNLLQALICLFGLPDCKSVSGVYELGCVDGVIQWVAA